MKQYLNFMPEFLMSRYATKMVILIFSIFRKKTQITFNGTNKFAQYNALKLKVIRTRIAFYRPILVWPIIVLIIHAFIVIVIFIIIKCVRIAAVRPIIIMQIMRIIKVFPWFGFCLFVDFFSKRSENSKF